MSFFGMKKFPAPVAKPMAPFFIAGLTIFYGINSFAEALKQTEEFGKDPRIPAPKTAKPANAH